MNPDFRKVALIAAALGLLVSLYFALASGDDNEAASTDDRRDDDRRRPRPRRRPRRPRRRRRRRPRPRPRPCRSTSLSSVASPREGSSASPSISTALCPHRHLGRRRRGPRARLRPDGGRRTRRAGDDPLHGRRTAAGSRSSSRTPACRSPSSKFAPEPARPRDQHVKDLPVPEWLFFWGGAVVLVFSFLALGALWKTPQSRPSRGGRPLPAGSSACSARRVLRASSAPSPPVCSRSSS